MKRLFLLLLIPVLIINACTSNEIGNTKDVHPEAIYFDYQISGEEGDEFITVLIQYRFGGSNGATLVLANPSMVELDGELLHHDSSRLAGAFYEIQKPVMEFAGHHRIVFTDINQKKYEEEFNFQPLILRTEIPAIVRRSDLVFELEGVSPVDYVRVLLTDTAFASEGINRVDTVRNGRVLIKVSALKNLVDGPVHLELYKEQEKPVKDRTPEGGRLSIRYGINREFVLAPADTLSDTAAQP